ncbi:divergent polysaccharide deacetylase family protein [Kordiimonas lacus]|uniref:Divergent polysaccharide deacetylase n=1 Tax=Kordiimonas lacus TaxID=637679 RepID=A0A1G7A2M7_9PROT|nr:divergent polysaccharide deacetylase family protein [Kordiimonas lacus]SDE08863.1 Divergent polysaccharide deacetylase [Kordiimonas lacus]
MPSSLNALLIAWAVSLIIIVGGTVYFELSYDPNEKLAAMATPDNADAGAATPPVQQTEPADAEPTRTDTADATPGDTQMDTADEPAELAATTRDEPTDDTPAMQQDMTTGMTQPVENPATQPNSQTQIRSGIRVDANPDLIEQTNNGPLPRVSPEGRRPFDEYAAPPPRNMHLHKIAIVITDMGQRRNSTQRVITELPSAVSFAFSPYSTNGFEWGEQSRRTGHEVLLMIPMEPINYPQNDPGPFTLLTSRSARENINLLRASLGRMSGYVGVVNHMGSRFTAASESLRPVLEELNRRGLMLLDSRASQYSRAASMGRDLGLPTAINNNFVDENVNPGEIAKQLAELESRARSLDYAVGMGRPYPVTVDAIKVWAAGLEERGFVLVPISAVANKQPLPR